MPNSCPWVNKLPASAFNCDVSATPAPSHTHLAKSAHEYSGRAAVSRAVEFEPFAFSLLTEHTFLPMLASANEAMLGVADAEADGDAARKAAGPISGTTEIRRPFRSRARPSCF